MLALFRSMLILLTILTVTMAFAVTCGYGLQYLFNTSGGVSAGVSMFVWVFSMLWVGSFLLESMKMGNRE